MAWNFLKKIMGNGDVVAPPEEAPHNNVSRIEHLSGQAFKKYLLETANSVLLDVRTPNEFAGGTIPGSLNVDFLSPNFAKNVGQLDQGVPYFVFCRSGNRSGQACQVMHQLGFDVCNLTGGIGEYPS